MCTTDESLQIRAFLENWSAKDEEKSDECDDNVEKVVRRNTSCVLAVNYKLKREDIESEVFDWLYCYLEERKCPYALAVTLSSAVSQSMAQQYNTEEAVLNGGTIHDLSGDELYRESINKVNELCDGYKLDAEEGIKLSVKHSLKPFVVSVCAIKNGRRRMEDRHVVLHDLNSLFGIKSNKQYSYYGVFDGHAGIHAATYTASHLHSNLIKSQAFKDGDIKSAIKHAFSETDLHYLERSAREGIRSGSTAVCCLFEGRNKLYLAWLGDSQAVLVKNGKPYDVMKPHKPERDDERHRIEEMGGLVSCIDTWRVNGTLAVSRAIGDPEHKPYVSSDPDVEEISLDGSEDFIIMACDGLWDQITPEEATTIVYQHLAENCESNLSEVSENISQILTDNAKKEGSTDNITVIVLFLRDVQSIVSTPFSPPSPKERSLVKNVLDFNENSSLGNHFANGSDINYNSSESEKNLLNSTNHVEAPTPPVDTVLSQNNLNFNYPFEINSQRTEDQKAEVNPFAEWENTDKLQENSEMPDNNFFTANVTVHTVADQEEKNPQLLDQNLNNPFEFSFKETGRTMADINKNDSQENTASSQNARIGDEFPGFTENNVEVEDKTCDSEVVKAEHFDEPDLCTQSDLEKVCFANSQHPADEKEINLVNFDSDLVCNVENETNTSNDTVEETLNLAQKVDKDVAINTNDEEFSNNKTLLLNSDDQSRKPIANEFDFGAKRESEVFTENTLDDSCEKTLYFSATDAHTEEKLPQEIIPGESQTDKIHSEVDEIKNANNELLGPVVDNSIKTEAALFSHGPLLLSEIDISKDSKLSSDTVVAVKNEQKETVEDNANAYLTVDTNLVPIDDTSDVDTEKDLEWKFMAVNETSETVFSSTEPVKSVDPTNKAITKNNTRPNAKTKPLSQVTTTKLVSSAKTNSRSATRPAVTKESTTTTTSAVSRRPAAGTNKPLSTKSSIKPGISPTTTSTTTTSTTTVANKRVLLSKTTTTRTITKTASTNSATTNGKTLPKSTVSNKTISGKPDGVKLAPVSLPSDKRSSLAPKSASLTTKTIPSTTLASRPLSASKSAPTKTAVEGNKTTLRKPPIATTATTASRTATTASRTATTASRTATTASRTATTAARTATSALRTANDPKAKSSTIATKRTSTTQLGSSNVRKSATSVGTKSTELKTSPKTSSRVNTGKVLPKTGSVVKNKVDNKAVPKVESQSELNNAAKEEKNDSAALVEEKSV